MKHRIGIIVLVAFLLAQCGPVETLPTIGSVNLTMEYKVDDVPLVPDSMIYQNKAGNQYSVNKLEYYLSNFELKKSDGRTIKVKGIYYINAFSTSWNRFLLDSIPVGTYDSLSFYVGLDSAQNLTDYLPNTTENANMFWPVPMGGGYHFMKMEGYYSDASGNNSGYAMHLGRNMNVVKVNIPMNFIVKYKNEEGKLKMNINEWYRNPNDFNFDTDGRYIMGDGVAMQKIAQNGKSAFTFTK